ncbi:MAG TPA: gliding motility-associated C-terminal domain-containing protein [Chitinophagaceae bacterium]|nr:gliding motility-associated C-terminal domain-containing protein [Chitinophagaceae bacterium]
MGCKITWVFILVCYSITCASQIVQPCTTLGQTPQTAFPVCGSRSFTQITVPYCANHAIPVPGCGNDYADVNPYWYKFTCYKSGTLAFTINPNNTNEDYDWQLFDVTGHDAAEVYTNINLVVAGNWSGTLGQTGASQSGTYLEQCESVPSAHINAFSSLPDVIQGHQYLLLVSHFTRAPNGYTLYFVGGTAVITDTAHPRLQSAAANCDGMSVTVTLNKKLTCASLAPNGSDFVLNTNAATVTGAQGLNCSSSFDMDTLTVQLSKPLQPGKYTLYMQTGTDGNTLLDYCDNAIPEGDSITFEVKAPQPVPFDSISPVGCAPKIIQLVFEKSIRCNSIAANGSDFTVTGATPVKVTGAGGSCVNGLSRIVNIFLAAPIQTAGTYQVNINRGSDGNTLIDECGEEVLPSSRSFITHDTVSAAFNYTLLYGCKTDTIVCRNNGNNGITSWVWNFTGGYTSQAQDTGIVYNDYGVKTIKLAVTNGACADSAETTVNLDNYFKAAFSLSSSFVCPGDQETFSDSSTGNITAWYWNFGNGLTSNQQNPQVIFPAVNGDENYNVRLVVQNNHNCFDTAYKPIKVLYTCYIAVPSAFTPNGDNLNDYLYPLNAYKTTSLEFKVFNRFGQLVFSTTDWTKKWDGNYKGGKAPPGTYVWTLSYTHTETHQKYFLKGTSVLIR